MVKDDKDSNVIPLVSREEGEELEAETSQGGIPLAPSWTGVHVDYLMSQTEKDNKAVSSKKWYN